jgi:hypothetical protein
MHNKEIKVSQLFVDIYRNFNVSDQREKIKELSKKELYFLLETCIDNHDENDLTVFHNFSPFSNEITNILNIHNNSLSNVDPDFETIKEKIYYDRVTETGESLPKVYTKYEVRDLKLNKILDK